MFYLWILGMCVVMTQACTDPQFNIKTTLDFVQYIVETIQA
jgi:hypothetical protein